MSEETDFPASDTRDDPAPWPVDRLTREAELAEVRRLVALNFALEAGATSTTLIRVADDVETYLLKGKRVKAVE